MPLFQRTIIKKHLLDLNNKEIDDAYNKFTAYFQNPTIQNNIRNSKEEQFQEGFLRELFGNVLNYTLNPNPGFNLTTELKNTTNSKKVDGAVVINDKAVAVIELKGTDTTDLSKIETQAFGYKNNQSECTYVITSNFEKLRFYIDNTIDFEEFNLFTLTREQFNLLYLCLSFKNIKDNVPKRLKLESVSQEDQITKKLYKDYSDFKRALFTNLVELNPEFDKLLLFKKTQKLLDRFLFILFAEDRLLLPTNLIFRINQEWKNLVSARVPVSLYERYKMYFNDLNLGAKVTLPAFGKSTGDAIVAEFEIFAYNGGLFQPDEVLDHVKIDDVLLHSYSEKLSHYDFDSDVDVNILGHIFENSLNEIDEIKAELEGHTVEKTKTKRKKDGVFYTPKYITKYIVDNTVGKLCEEKKVNLDIKDEYYINDKKQQTRTKKALLDKLAEYRKWLLELTICDPACGSGAFLNQALEFLISEHRYVDELQAKLMGDAMILSDVENSILEHNIYGVDLNDESVEIAKLSLWLRTAQKGRKLNSLNNNIKCGNSLIDDPNVAGDKAFSWEKEFPEVFAKGGFDVVIGNPPYLRVQGLRENFEKETKFYEKFFKSATGRFDVYVLFMEKSFTLISEAGVISFILPHKFLVSDFGEGIRDYFVTNRSVQSIIHFGSEMVFNDASTYTCIINLSRNNRHILFKQVNPKGIFEPKEFEIASYDTLSKEKWNLKNDDTDAFFKKLNSQPWTVKDVFENISQGIVSVGDDIFLLKGKIEGDKFIGFSDRLQTEVILEAQIVKPMLKGEDVKKYSPLNNTYFCLYPHYQENGKTKPLEEDLFNEKYPLAYKYILPYKDELIEKKIRYKTNPTAWYSLHRSREISLFEQVKIITPEISLGTNMTIDSHHLYHNTKCYSIVKKSNVKEGYKFWLAILNSKLLWYYLSSTGYVLRGGFFTFKTKYLEPFPLPRLSDLSHQDKFIEKVNIILQKTEFVQNEVNKVKNYIASKYPGIFLTNKLQNWYELEFPNFVTELNKAIKKTDKEKLSQDEEIDWSITFKKYSDSVGTNKREIADLSQQIDRMVYELYGLTEEEIKIVEGDNIKK